MMIIKEVCREDPSLTKNKTLCIIRTNTYAKSVAHVMDLLKIAQSDFPKLKTEDVQIVFYAGERYRKTLGLEFNPPSTVPSDYQEIAETEFILV